MAHRARVLVIEDDPATRELFSVVLDEEGFDAVCGSNAEDALSRMDGASAVVTDLEAAEDLTIRSMALPLLIVSASPEASDYAHAIGAEFLAKPFDIEELASALRGLMRESPLT